MGWTDPVDWTALEKLRAADLNEQLRDNLGWLKDQVDLLTTTNPRARVSAGSAVTIPNGTPTAVPFDTVSWDVGPMHSGTKLFAPRPGIYSGLVYGVWATDARGFRRIGVAVNGGTVVTTTKVDTEGSDPMDMCCPWEIFMDEGDYAEFHAYYADGTFTLDTLDLQGAAMTAAWKGSPT